uniref:Uncharacterized protein n=1 Tax=Caenorhabditis japonica TaxID=281687 RepID=A0A8R1IKM1_CAEJA
MPLTSPSMSYGFRWRGVAWRNFNSIRSFVRSFVRSLVRWWRWWWWQINFDYDAYIPFPSSTPTRVRFWIEMEIGEAVYVHTYPVCTI